MNEGDKRMSERSKEWMHRRMTASHAQMHTHTHTHTEQMSLSIGIVVLRVYSQTK